MLFTRSEVSAPFQAMDIIDIVALQGLNDDQTLLQLSAANRHFQTGLEDHNAFKRLKMMGALAIVVRQRHNDPNDFLQLSTSTPSKIWVFDMKLQQVLRGYIAHCRRK
jgi:hypothetical protein